MKKYNTKIQKRPPKKEQIYKWKKCDHIRTILSLGRAKKSCKIQEFSSCLSALLQLLLQKVHSAEVSINTSWKTRLKYFCCDQTR